LSGRAGLRLVRELRRVAAVRGQRGIDGVGWHGFAEFGPGGAVAVAGVGDRTGEDVSGDRG
jgi:hypothetical protein